MQLVHHRVTDFRALDLSLPFFLKVLLDPTDNLLNDVNANGPLLTGLLQAIEDFEAIEHLSPSIFLNHHGKSFLRPLAGGESLLTAKAFPATPTHLLILAEAGSHPLSF